MIKKLCILFLSALAIVPSMAQYGNSKDDASFRPKKGDWQVNLNMGAGQFFNELNGMNYLLPSYLDGYGNTNVPDLGLDTYGLTANQSEDLGIALDLGAAFNDNSIVNIASIQGAYFLTDRIQLNAFFSLDMNVTPKKDYMESAYYEDGDPLNLPGYKYMEGRVSSKWMLGVGGNYYFPTRNERINLYAGGMVGFQMGRVETVTPYSGETINDNVTDDEGQTDGEQIEGESGKEPIELFRPTNKAGTVWAIRGALVTGIEYSIMKGMILGFEVQPAAYNYTVLRIQPQGMASYNAAHHNIRVLACPSLKIGFRF
ncbi:hypothetical protein H6A61_14500 [Bacteroides caecigallinarum]|uniref:BT1926 family outer membrane beta-barrel protein n=1 Tax=Bacteroides caecigallinarum TaxID=1411144 RepID=UPI0019578DEE|nr:BT1926 family outer membrane beta-barrel protein [Bacteroides caecigallinarum]MBM6962042.1 hypothetical protein [Bacteroides caecigallinarum]